jgi:hypothetical protein
MNLSIKLKALAAAAALLVGGQAFAQTNIQAGSGAVGTLFLNVWDQTAQTSYVINLADTSLGSSFTVSGFTDPAGPLSLNLSSDANWTSFVASESAGDSIVYSILGVVTTHNADVVDQTGTSLTGLGNNSNLKTLAGNLFSGYIASVNGIAASTTPNALAYSQFVTNVGNPSAYYGIADAQFGSSPSETGAVGTALNFYQISLGSPTSGSTAGLVATTYNGTWDLLSNGTLTYGSAVPLPKSWILLLSGLLLMGVIARRGKSAGASDDLLPGAAA